MKKPIATIGGATRLALTIAIAAGVAQAQRGAAPPRAPAAPTASTYNGPRTPDRKPDLNGIWQALGTAHWNLEAHSASEGVPAGFSVVEGGAIPYQPWALAKRSEEHTSELQSLTNLVCRLLLEKKKKEK